MNIPPFDGLMVPVWLVVGIVAGLFYFRCLAWNVRQFAAGGSVTMTIVLMAGRMAVLGGLLTLASLRGALPLLITALGILIARFVSIRRTLSVHP